MGLLKKIFGMEFEGKVVEVELIEDSSKVSDGKKRFADLQVSRQDFEITPGGRFKGYTEDRFAFNKDYFPAIYKIVLENKGKRREFRVCTDNPPEIDSNQTYRTDKGNRILYY